ncbi:MAG: PQQ-dependent sugar dehydrogenase [Pseudomonadota bacterium]
MGSYRIGRWLGVGLIAIAVSACGGGSSGGTTNPPVVVNPDVAISDSTVTEGDSGTVVLSFTVSVSGTLPAGASFADASVEYAVADGTAEAGTDYTSVSGTLQIPSGTRTASIDIPVIGDSLEEVDETLTVTLSSPVNAQITRASATGTIRDDDSSAVAFGLDTRPDNQTCVAPARPTAGSSVEFVDVYPAISDFLQPTKLLLEPGPSGRWFVLQKMGQILTFDPANPNAATEYLDLNDTRNIRTNSEGGLLGMAFHPDYPTTPEIFLSYTVEHTGPNMRSVISRFVLDDVTAPGPGATEQIIIEIDQDFDNHNGGDIAFGPDGFLYVGLGDGGSGNDPRARAQDTTRLLGSMLRLDVQATGGGYRIPTDNPFASNPPCGPGANSADCPEIFAWGLRNPWRWAFDPEGSTLWLADVGQGALEEVNQIRLAGNYGWRCKEGTRETGNASDCDLSTLIDPVTEYGRSLGNSITGGQVYRGTEIPDLIGLYVFADYGSGRVWVARPDGNGGFTNDQLANTSLNPTAFASGPDGELYLVDINGSNGRGRVRRMQRVGAATPDTIPDRLSDSGCTQPGNTALPYSGLLPYSLNAPFWSDAAEKDRYIGLPNNETIGINAEGDFEFPVGTVIVKNFRLGGRLIETRHLMRHTDGSWAGYTYEWNAAQTDAIRVQGGKVATIGSQQWIYPSESQCMQCHTSAAGFALGPEINQLNRDFQYPSTGRTANQLETIEHVQMLTAPLPGAVNTLDALADPADTGQSLERRARAYLDTNCASCHRPNGPVPTDLDLRAETALSATNACDVTPTAGSLGIVDARLIAPGDASRSIIVDRMQRRDVHGMPPVGSNLVDNAGVTLVSNWIDQLPSCN